MSTKKQKKTLKAAKKAIMKRKTTVKSRSLHKHVHKKTVVKARAKHKHVHKKVVKIKAPKTPKAIKLTKEAKAKNAEKLQKQQLKDAQFEHQRRATELITNKVFLDTMNRQVGANAHDILVTLSTGARTDEEVATQLNMKVNDIRRMLNVMNGYSIVRYDVNKDSKGWLIFKWRIDTEKLGEYITEMEKVVEEAGPVLPANTNDFFMCKKCYVEQKVILPFDSAFEYNFTCGDCGKPFAILNKEQTVQMFKEANQVQTADAPASA